MSRLDDYTVRLRVEVRFRDTDMLGHVNNAVYLTYFESGRMAYWTEFTGRAHAGRVPFILARAEVDFRAEARAGEKLTLGIRASRMGTRSFDFQYLVVREEDGTEVATGRTVQVFYDYEAGRSAPLPDDLRADLQAFEGNRLQRDEARPETGNPTGGER